MNTWTKDFEEIIRPIISYYKDNKSRDEVKIILDRASPVKPLDTSVRPEKRRTWENLVEFALLEVPHIIKVTKGCYSIRSGERTVQIVAGEKPEHQLLILNRKEAMELNKALAEFTSRLPKEVIQKP